MKMIREKCFEAFDSLISFKKEKDPLLSDKKYRLQFCIYYCTKVYKILLNNSR